MNFSESSLLNLFTKAVSSGSDHYDFDLPTSIEDQNQLMASLKSLESKNYIQILESPDTGYDYIFVDLYPVAFNSK